MIEARRAPGKRLFLWIAGWAAAGLLGSGWTSPALSATKVLIGKHAIVYDIVNPTGVEFLPNYANSSYSQKVLQEDEFSKRVLIEVNLAPLNSSALFPVSAQQIPYQMRSFLGPEKISR